MVERESCRGNVKCVNGHALVSLLKGWKLKTQGSQRRCEDQIGRISYTSTIEGCGQQYHIAYPKNSPLTPFHCQGVMKALSHPITPVGSRCALLTLASALWVDQSVKSNNKNWKCNNWTRLKAIQSTSLQSKEFPSPEMLRFAVDFNNPFNQQRKAPFERGLI